MALLEAHSLTKKFAGITALSGVNFELKQGEIHALCGENGAGKSTLIKLLSGVYPFGSYEGELRLNNTLIAFKTVRDAQEAGMAVVTQELSLIDELNIAENIFLGNLPQIGFRVDWAKVYENTADLLKNFDLKLSPKTKVGDLGVGQKQLIEIIRAINKHPSILVLDEPTAALADHEIELLISHLKRLKAEGVSCIYISHKLDEVFQLSDRITVLRDGQTIKTVQTSETTRSDIIRYMVGRQISDLFPKRINTKPGEVLLETDQICVADDNSNQVFIKNITLQVKGGEVLGIGGLMGAGRTSLLMHLVGAWGKRVKGKLYVRNRLVDNKSAPKDSIKQGLVLVSEDRRRYGLIIEQTVGFNISLSHLSHYAKFGKLSLLDEYDDNQKMYDFLHIKAVNQNSSVEGLSGGNQQKVVIGKALMTEPQIILFDEPTRGIDVGAKLEIYELINRLTDAGKAVVLVSSELPELMAMSDRIVMMHEGELSSVFNRNDYTQEILLSAAMGQL